MDTVYDVRQLLKRYHTFIYTGDRIGDLELMEMEIEDLFQLKFISQQEFLKAKLILKGKNRSLPKIIISKIWEFFGKLVISNEEKWTVGIDLISSYYSLIMS